MPNSKFVNDRLHFLKVDEDTVAELKRARAIIEPKMDDMLEHFYAHLKSEPALRTLFPDQETIERAGKAQKEHWLSTLFEGILDSSYFDKTNRIGQAHARIGLTPSWYIGGYSVMVSQFVDSLVKDESIDRESLSSAIQAVQKAVFLDMDMVIHCYLDAKDETMLDMLRRATTFAEDVDGLCDDIRGSADDVCFIAKALPQKRDGLDEIRRQLERRVEGLTEQIELLKERLGGIQTRDRLYIAEDITHTGTFARLKAFVFRDDEEN